MSIPWPIWILLRKRTLSENQSFLNEGMTFTPFSLGTSLVGHVKYQRGCCRPLHINEPLFSYTDEEWKGIGHLFFFLRIDHWAVCPLWLFVFCILSHKFPQRYNNMLPQRHGFVFENLDCCLSYSWVILYNIWIVHKVSIYGTKGQW